MTPAHRSVMTPPASLMCYASRLVTIRFWARLSSCVFLGPSGSIAYTEGYMAEGGDRRGLIRCLFNFSYCRRCQSHLYLLMLPFSHQCQTDSLQSRKEMVEGLTISEVGLRAGCLSSFLQYIIDAVFLLLELERCIMHIKFKESIIVSQPLELWEHFSPSVNLVYVKCSESTSATSFLEIYVLFKIFQRPAGISVEPFFHDCICKKLRQNSSPIRVGFKS